MQPQVIETAEELEALCERLASEEELAFDLEGDGLFRYRSNLCTVQLATRDGEVVVEDTLAIDDLSALGRLLSTQGPRKLVHDVSYDARLLSEHDIDLGNVFDTSVAARFLGEESTGLAALLKKRFDVNLPKDQQQSDWGRRPLEPRDLEYLAADVHHLFDLGAQLEAECEDRDIAEEVREETAYLLHRALTDEPDDRPPWTRIKGRDSLDDVGLAVLREVAEERERAARKMDVPPFKIVGNRQLLEMARRRPKSGPEMSKIKGAARGRARRYTGAFLQAIRRGEAAGAVPEDERVPERTPPPPPEEREARKRRQRALNAWRAGAADDRRVDPQVVLPGHCLQDIAARGASTAEDLLAIPGFGEVRRRRYADDIINLLAAVDES